MKALCVREPWAGMILAGKKTIEVRTWRTKFRGDFILCASAKPKTDLSGKALAIVELIDCREPRGFEDGKAACCEIFQDDWCWVVGNVRPIKSFGIKGKLGFFVLDREGQS